MDKYIPKFEVILPIAIILFLNLLAYANVEILNVRFSGVDIFTMTISFIYFYIAMARKITFKELIYFCMIGTIMSIFCKGDSGLMSTTMLVTSSLFFQSQQKAYITLTKIFIAIIMQYGLMILCQYYIGMSVIVYSICYLPFSLLIYKGGAYVGKILVFKKSERGEQN